MKTKLILLAAICIATLDLKLETLNCFAQITFQKTFGTNSASSSVQVTPDGGYIIAGSTWSFGAGSADVYLVRTDANGNALWTKTFGGTNDDYGSSVQVTPDGGYIITGYTNSFGAGNSDVYLLKTDGNGDTLWTKTFGGTSYDYGSSVQVTPDGGYIIAGRTGSFGAGNYDIYLLKTDANGNSLWTKTFGGANGDMGNSVQVTSDGGYIIAGYTWNFSVGGADVCLLKTDAQGNTLWTKTFGGISGDMGYFVQQTSDGGYVIAGSTSSFGAGSADVYLLKTDTNGNTLWTKTFGGTGYDEGYSVQVTPDGGYIIAGSTYSFGAGFDDVYLLKTDGNGNSIWTKTFGGIDLDGGSSVQVTPDGGYLIAGRTYSFGAGVYDVYLIKTDSLGNSNCNEANAGTIVTTPATIAGSPATQVSSGAVVGNPATQTSSGGVVTTLCSTGINELNSETSIVVFPNPASGKFVVQITNQYRFTDYELEIYNVFGEKATRSVIPSGERNLNINMSSYPNGIYFLHISTEQGRAVKKIIINK